MDAARTLQVQNTITHEKDPDEEVPTEATAPLQARQYGDASGGKETACCERVEELGKGVGVEELGRDDEDAVSEVEMQDGQQLLRSQHRDNSPVKGRALRRVITGVCGTTQNVCLMKLSWACATMLWGLG